MSEKTSFISTLIGDEIEGRLAKNSVTVALTAYKQALILGLSEKDADILARQIYENQELRSLSSGESRREVRQSKEEFRIILERAEKSTAGLIRIVRSLAGLTIRQAKEIVDSIPRGETFSKGGLSREQALSILNNIKDEGGDGSIEPEDPRGDGGK